MKKIGIVMLVVIFSMFISSCMHPMKSKEKEITMEEAEVRFKEMLKERYGKDFEIEKLIKQAVPSLFVTAYIYSADAYAVGEESNKIEISLNLEGTYMKDDYPRYIFGGKIESTAEDIMKKEECIEDYTIEVLYSVNSAVWKDTSDYEDYLKYSGLIIVVECTLEELSHEELAANLEKLLNSFKENQLYVKISGAIYNQFVVGVYRENKITTYEELLSQLEEMESGKENYSRENE